MMLANTYTRLSLLEDAAKNEQASRDYMAKAQFWHKAAEGHDYSHSEMKSALKAADQRLRQLGLQ